MCGLVLGLAVLSVPELRAGVAAASSHVSQQCSEVRESTFGGRPISGDYGKRSSVCFQVTVGATTPLMLAVEVGGQYGYVAKDESRARITSAGGDVSHCSVNWSDNQSCLVSGRIDIVVTRGSWPTYGFWLYNLTKNSGCAETGTPRLRPAGTIGKPRLMGQVLCYGVNSSSGMQLVEALWASGPYPGAPLLEGEMVNTAGQRLCLVGVNEVSGLGNACRASGPVKVLLTETFGYQLLTSYAFDVFNAASPQRCRVVNAQSGGRFTWNPWTANDPLCVRVVGKGNFEITTTTFPELSVLDPAGRLENGVNIPSGFFPKRCYPLWGKATVLLLDSSPSPTPGPQPMSGSIGSCPT